MTYYADLSPYEYSDPAPPALNIGWLSSEHDYPRGLAPNGLVARLRTLAKNLENVYRGVHFCELCPTLDAAREHLHSEGLSLGTGEIWVTGSNGVTYAAPSLIIHYIVDHGYLPPEEFRTAVMEAGHER
ncbi:DUF7919 family protein [Streptomyces varsoviensis]|uniref:DUF7919 family protein n=1 Tax=Streptomyces varsoviensis TaxID=67373 RepID=UPI000AC75631|nr:hypothetical protein [Streptomyces varsoviensis]